MDLISTSFDTNGTMMFTAYQKPLDYHMSHQIVCACPHSRGLALENVHADGSGDTNLDHCKEAYTQPQ